VLKGSSVALVGSERVEYPFFTFVHQMLHKAEKNHENKNENK
jgi:hypothetical protein